MESANLKRNISHQPFHTNGLWNILKYWETASTHKPGKKAKFPIRNVRFVCLITSLRRCEAHLHNVCKVMFVEHCMAHASRKGARHRSGDWTGDQTLGSYLVIIWQLLHCGCRHLESSALQLIKSFLSINCVEGPCVRLPFTDGLRVAAVFYCILLPHIDTAFIHTGSDMDFQLSAVSGQFKLPRRLLRKCVWKQHC